jgi:anti-sigma regulatory factor (Ser/Thr protein kinase)
VYPLIAALDRPGWSDRGRGRPPNVASDPRSERGTALTRAPRFVQRTAGAGVSAPRHAAFNFLPRHGRRAAAKNLITFLHRVASQKRAPAAESESLPGSGATAESLRSEPGAAVLDTPASLESERELMALDIVCANCAPALVRAALSEISELDAVHDDVMLVASELVTNAVLHSGGTAGDTIHVQAVLGAGHVLLSVDDPGLSDDTPRIRNADDMGASGHGLRIVNQLARRWGAEPNGRHRVWAELATGHLDTPAATNILSRDRSGGAR